MQLPRDGQEYVHITFTDLPFNTPIEVSIDNRETWRPTEPANNINQRKILVRGPDSTRTEGALLTKNTALWVRAVDNPETVVRNAGFIYLK